MLVLNRKLMTCIYIAKPLGVQLHLTCCGDLTKFPRQRVLQDVLHSQLQTHHPAQ